TSISCAECHSDVNEKADERPCVKTGRVACANCHRGFGEQYTKSVHGKALAAGNMDAPYCSDCHGSHNIKFHMDPDSPTFKAEIPTLCGGCHGGEKPPEAISPKGAVAMADYSSSVHGLEVLRKGHMAPAVCIDCHSSHGMLDSSNPASSVHRDNLPATCGSCHEDVYRDFVSSVHYSHYDSEAKNFPACDDCHSSHKISKVTGPKFNMEINFQCGGCHENLAATYGDTIHGKIHKLGYEKAAKCSDCHGAHTILPPANPASSVAKGNLVRTCSKCHRKVTENFTGFMPHADYHSMEKRPVIYYTYWFMTLLLFGVFGFFGLHTLLWLPRALAEAVKAKRAGHAPTGRFVRRFELRHRVTHIFVIVSFLSLALTGMMLKYSYQPWAQTLADLLGGVSGAAFIHRVAAIVTFGYFFYHIRQLALMKRQSGLSWLGFTFRPESMMFNLNDIRTFWRNVKWFTWLGPRPEYGRFTYWEKFDYFAVFWGVPIIGLSGLVLWFPVFFTHWLPGWIINLAMIVHSDEALLAVGFIFTIHFFNTHLRPEAFPMDPVIFTGLAPEEKYMEERSEDYAAMKESGELDEVIVTEPLEPKWVRLAYIAGSVFLGLGIILIALILKTALGW
ncbi:MAG: cytochrome c3 family protein, partial [Nitrospinota bacterium]|nr:cytochrome c3 family protein [Nitrospinota bacterium]